MSQICDTLTQVDIEQASQPESAIAITEKICQSVMFYPQDYAVSYNAFTACYFNGFTYKIGDVKTGKDTAGNETATVQLTASIHSENTTKSALFDAYSSTRSALGDEAYAVAVSAMDSKAKNDGVADAALIDTYKKTPWPSEEVTITVVMGKNSSGEWVPVDYASFSAALLGGIDIRQDIS